MKKNGIGKALYGIGIATMFVGGFISLIISIIVDHEFPITWIAGGLASFISGMCLLGFSEIISLLQTIVNRLDCIKNTDNNKCKNCGSEFEESGNFCTKCGAKR